MTVPAHYFDRAAVGYTLPGPGGNPMARPVAEVYIHHEGDGLPPTRTTAASLAKARDNQVFHISKGWQDIGYSGMFDDQGNTLEGRGWDRTGAHTENFNSKGYGFCWLGDSTLARPTDAAVWACADYIRWGIDDGWLIATPTIVAHSERSATACCGDALRARIPDIRDAVATPQPQPSTSTGDPSMLQAFQLPKTGGPADSTVYVRNPATGLVVTLDSLGLSVATYNELVTRGMAVPFVEGARLTFEANALLAWMDQSAFTTPRDKRATA